MLSFQLFVDYFMTFSTGSTMGITCGCAQPKAGLACGLQSKPHDRSTRQVHALVRWSLSNFVKEIGRKIRIIWPYYSIDIMINDKTLEKGKILQRFKNRTI
jgi:hypothetical protein